VAALEGVLPRADVPLRLAVAPFAMPGKAESAVAVVLGVRQQIPGERSNRNGAVKVIAAAFDRDGRSVQSENQTVGVAWRPDASGRSPYDVVVAPDAETRPLRNSRGADRFTANHSADYRLELPLERLPRGEYLLTIDGSVGPRTVRRGVRFTVR
jgi:hypothetical protein